VVSFVIIPQHDIRRVAPGRRDKGSSERPVGDNSAHSRRIGATLIRQRSFKIALWERERGFCMANEEEAWHRAR
jgi:hypothetical protein